MRLSSMLFKAARFTRDVGAVSTGKPKRIERRVKNRVIGRALAGAGFWRWLWK